jgi:hypothetical protein
VFFQDHHIWFGKTGLQERWKKDMIRELGREGFLVSACFSPVAFSPPFCLFDPSDWLFSSL